MNGSKSLKDIRKETLQALTTAKANHQAGKITGQEKNRIFAEAKKEYEELFGEGEFVKLYDVVYRKKRFNFGPYMHRIENRRL